jgi:hypothetical protein
MYVAHRNRERGPLCQWSYSHNSGVIAVAAERISDNAAEINSGWAGNKFYRKERRRDIWGIHDPNGVWRDILDRRS